MPAAVKTTTMSSRAAIEYFCRNFFSGHYDHLQRIAGEYEDRFCSIDVQTLSDSGTFDSAFQDICRRVFTSKQSSINCSDAYVIAVLGFALRMNKQLKDYSWYTQETMICSLTNALVEVNFKPYRLVSTTHITCTLF